MGCGVRRHHVTSLLFSNEEFCVLDLMVAPVGLDLLVIGDADALAGHDVVDLHETSEMAECAVEGPLAGNVMQ